MVCFVVSSLLFCLELGLSCSLSPLLTRLPLLNYFAGSKGGEIATASKPTDLRLLWACIAKEITLSLLSKTKREGGQKKKAEIPQVAPRGQEVRRQIALQAGRV